MKSLPKVALAAAALATAIAALLKQESFREFMSRSFGNGRDRAQSAVKSGRKKVTATVTKVRPAAQKAAKRTKAVAEKLRERAERFLAHPNPDL